MKFKLAQPKEPDTILNGLLVKNWYQVSMLLFESGFRVLSIFVALQYIPLKKDNLETLVDVQSLVDIEVIEVVR